MTYRKTIGFVGEELSVISRHFKFEKGKYFFVNRDAFANISSENIYNFTVDAKALLQIFAFLMVRLLYNFPSLLAAVPCSLKSDPAYFIAVL